MLKFLMEIHALFILKESGECIYNRIFSKQFENLQVNLITPLFSAFFVFSREVLSEQPEVLELGKYRFIFRKLKSYIFAIQADTAMSNVYIKNCLEKITEVFFVGLENRGWKEYEVINDLKFDAVIDDIIFGGVNILKKIDLYKKLEDYFNDLMVKDDILGAGLLSTTGEIIHSALPERILVTSLKELEFKYMSGISSLPEIFYSLENGQKVFSRMVHQAESEINFLVVILFKAKVLLGMAEITLQKIVKELENIW
jgi:hypothetical protein